MIVLQYVLYFTKPQGMCSLHVENAIPDVLGQLSRSPLWTQRQET